MSVNIRFSAVGAMASALLLVSVAQSPAQAISPGDVKIVEGQVTASLTGKAGDAAAGKKVFINRKQGNCLACHTNKDASKQPFHGEIGPELNGVADRYTEPQMRAILVNSKQVFGNKTIMPSFYRIINDQRSRKQFHDKPILQAQQVEDVIAYLKTLKE